MKKTAFIIIALLLAFGCSDEKHEVPKEDNPLFSTSRAISLNQLGETINLEKIGIYNPTKVIKKDSLLIVLDLNGLNKISIYQEIDDATLHIRTDKFCSVGFYLDDITGK